eukprot:jgi/Botrbrau1/3303/Bobra.0048s0001.1
MLDDGGRNFEFWYENLEACANTKGVRAALERPMPGSVENSAIKQWLIQSVPVIWHSQISCHKAAFDFIAWVKNSHTGGSNQDINLEWYKEMEQGHQDRGDTQGLPLQNDGSGYKSQKQRVHHLSRLWAHALPAEPSKSRSEGRLRMGQT